MVLTQLPRSEVHRGHVQGNSSEDRNAKTETFKLNGKKGSATINE